MSDVHTAFYIVDNHMFLKEATDMAKETLEKENNGMG